MHGRARSRGQALALLDDPTDVLGAGAAAAADDLHAHLGDEAPVVLGQLVRGQVVGHLPVDHRGHAGVGQARDRHAGVLGEVAEVLAHLVGPGGAVEADDVGAQRVDRRQGGADLGAGQHAAGQLDGDLDLERDLTALGGHGPAGGDHGRLEPEQVVLGLDDQEVDAALEQAVHLDLVGVAQIGEGDVPE